MIQVRIGVMEGRGGIVHAPRLLHQVSMIKAACRMARGRQGGGLDGGRCRRWRAGGAAVMRRLGATVAVPL
jgi:hypothetical protein